MNERQFIELKFIIWGLIINNLIIFASIVVLWLIVREQDLKNIRELIEFTHGNNVKKVLILP